MLWPRSGISLEDHPDQARNERVSFCFAAWSTGKKPPTSPRSAANAIPWPMIWGVTWNWNAISENDWKFVVLEVMPFMGSASTQPTSPPITATITDSTTNDTKIDHEPKPSTESMAISRVREPIVAYIVLAAPNTAPIAMIAVMNEPITVIRVVNASLCLA